MTAKAARMASQPASPGRQNDGDGEGLGGDQGGLPVAGEHQPLVEGQGLADGGEHGEAGDEGQRVQPGTDQGQVAAVHSQDLAGGKQPEAQDLVPGQRGHQQVPGRDEHHEQQPGEPVAGLVAQREPPRGRELGERGRRAGSRGGSKVSGGHGGPSPTARGG
jgi:hypothetical protein